MRPGRRGDVGAFEILSLTSEGAGLGFYIRPPAGILYRVIGWRCRMVNDATVSDRNMMWHIYDGTNFGKTYVSNVIHGAGVTRYYIASCEAPGTGYNANVYTVVPWDIDIFVSHDFWWWIDPSGIQGGDTMDLITAFVEKWLDE